MHEPTKKTCTVLNELGTTYWRLQNALRSGKVMPLPHKDASGDLAWTDADIARVRAALNTDRRKKSAGAEPALAS